MVSDWLFTILFLGLGLTSEVKSEFLCHSSFSFDLIM